MTPQAQKYQQSGDLYLAIAQLLAERDPELAKRTSVAELASLMRQSQSVMDDSGKPGQVRTVADMRKVVGDSSN